jgi:hypothetical protein
VGELWSNQLYRIATILGHARLLEPSKAPSAESWGKEVTETDIGAQVLRESKFKEHGRITPGS